MNLKFRSLLLTTVASINLSVLLPAQPVFAQAFTNLIFFGDSNTDSGINAAVRGVTNSNAAFVAQYGAVPNFGAYTTSPGRMWSVALGQIYGVTVSPAASVLAQTLGLQLAGGGNNYAVGGARVTYTDPTNPQIWSAASQVSAYLNSTGGAADRNALYTVYIGINDLKTTTTGGFGNIVNPMNSSQLQALAQQVSALPLQLKQAGARYILVPNATSAQSSASAAAAAGVNWNSTVNQSLSYYTHTKGLPS